MRLGYEYQSLKDADIHPETRIFLNRFVPAIQRINRDKNLTVEQILATIEEIHGIIKNNDMGKEFLGRLLDQTADIKLIDFDHPEDNDFAVVDELTFGPEAKGSFRPDVTVLVNGIPLGFLEVKKPNNEGGIQKEFHRMLDERLQVPEFKKYFNMLQFVTFSNNMEYETDNDAAPAEEVRAGSFYSTPNGNRTFFSFFREENPKTSGFKEIYMDEVRYILKDNGYSPSYADTEEFQTNLQPSTPCNRFVTSFFDIPRMMYLLQYGFFYVDTIDEKTGQPVTQKHIMRYPQFFASQAILKRIDGGGKSGIIFHTQGSGKTELSAFSTRIIRDYYSERGITAKFYYVVDRLDLLIQVRDEMRNRGLNAIEVNSRSDFEKELKRPLPKRGDLRSNGEIVVVNIQKFTDALPQVSNVYDAKIQRIFFVDEAHRSYKQTGQFFKNLMLVDDNAIYIAMTGTPLLSKKERSNLKFGDYIHKKCCLSKDVPDIYQCIKDTVAENGYPSKLSDTICAMLRYMKKNNLLGGCHATASAMYVALSEQGFKTELCVGEIGSPDMSPFDHSWVTVDDKVIDLACYMPLPNSAGITNASYPIVLSTDVVTKSTPKLTYGVETGMGFDFQTQQLLRMPFVDYLDNYPFEKNGLWTVIQRISPVPINYRTLREKYSNVQRKICK